MLLVRVVVATIGVTIDVPSLLSHGSWGCQVAVVAAFVASGRSRD